MAVSLRGVTKRYEETVALDSVDLDIATGSLSALLGPSGGGKSTLLRVVAGLVQPDAGSVHIGGEDVTRRPARARGIGFCFQHHAPFNHMTVWKNVAFGLEVRRRPKAEIRATVAELLEVVQLGGLANRYPGQLSGGQRQRMALARALAVDPAVLLLDEPFGSLDTEVRRDLRTWLVELHARRPVTTILVTHDPEEALEVADHLAVVRNGVVEQAGTPADLYDRPATEFVLGFLGPATRIGEDWVRPHDIVLRRAPFPDRPRAEVVRVARLGFEVRVELRLDTGATCWAQLSRGEAAGADLQPGDQVALEYRALPRPGAGLSAPRPEAVATVTPAGSDRGRRPGTRGSRTAVAADRAS